MRAAAFLALIMLLPTAAYARDWVPATSPPNDGAPSDTSRATEAADDAEPADVERPHRLGLEFGMRFLVSDDPGLDPYAEDDVLPQALLAASYTPFSVGPFAFGVATEYDVGRVTAEARDQPSSLLMHRLAGGLQAQLELWRFQLYTRGMAGGLYAFGAIEDSGAPGDLEASGWTWAADVTAGARFRLGSAGGKGERPVIAFWLLAEGGYSFAGSIAMAFAPAEEEDESRQFGALQLPDIHPDGPAMRFGFALSFL